MYNIFSKFSKFSMSWTITARNRILLTTKRQNTILLYVVDFIRFPKKPCLFIAYFKKQYAFQRVKWPKLGEFGECFPLIHRFEGDGYAALDTKNLLDIFSREKKFKKLKLYFSLILPHNFRSFLNSMLKSVRIFFFSTQYMKIKSPILLTK